METKEYTETPVTLDRVELLYADESPEEASRLLSSLYGQVLTSSERGRALALQVMCLEKLGRSDEAEEFLVEHMQDEGDDHAFVLAAGMEFSNLDSFLHAEIFLRNLSELRPEDPVPCFNLAVTLGREGRYQESAAVYDETLRRQPDFVDALFQRAYCLSLLNDLEGSAASYREFLKHAPEDAEAWQALGVVESDRGAFDEAYAAYGKAAEFTSDPIEVYYNWAVTAVRKNDTQQLAKCVEALQDLDPEDWRVMMIKADWEEAMGHHWPAWELLNEAFSAVLEEPDAGDADPNLAAYLASAVLRFAKRNDMADHTEDVITAIFQHRVFGSEALEALRYFEGRVSGQVRSYQVVLKLMPEQGDVSYVVYGIATDSSEDAEARALAFQARVDPVEASAWTNHVLTEPDEGSIGVYWRSEELDAPPGDGESL